METRISEIEVDLREKAMPFPKSGETPLAFAAESQ